MKNTLSLSDALEAVERLQKLEQTRAANMVIGYSSSTYTDLMAKFTDKIKVFIDSTEIRQSGIEALQEVVSVAPPSDDDILF